MNSLVRKFVFFCKHSHLHGLKYVVSSDRNIFLRFLWAAIFITDWILMTVMFLWCIRSYQDNSISFLTETTYLEWNTTFPSVAVCQQAGTDISWLQGKFDPRDNTAILEFFVTDLLFFTGSCYSCQTECFTCPKLNISDLVLKLRKPCSKILGKCKWNQIEFDCCDQFLPLETEYGVCYAINSLHTKQSTGQQFNLNFKMNRDTGVGQLSVETLEDVRVYFHGPEDVPFINIESNYIKDVTVGESVEIIFNIAEIVNDANLYDISVHKRKCRYPWEVPKNLKVHKFYSYSTCLVQCHADNQKRLCNCTHHLMPYYNKISYCNIDGLKCLSDNVEILNRLHAKGSTKSGLDCDCYPSCMEPEYNVIQSQRLFNVTSGITLKLHSLPTSRFKRVLVKDNLDLVGKVVLLIILFNDHKSKITCMKTIVNGNNDITLTQQTMHFFYFDDVSVGGVAGFFIGASLQTIVEIVYLVFVRS